MKVLLAPMEGVVDPIVRELYTAIGGIDYCVTEFIRVSDNVYPNKVFLKYCPELLTESKTSSGTPVFVQLLGGKAQPMAENAQKVCQLGAYGIDLNFGCPAKTVNRHDGGAALLKNPERIFNITNAIRQSVPKEKPVTVKVRLGYSDKTLTKEIAQAAQEGGAHWLTVHARTKEEAYRPPAHWDYIAEMRETVSIPVIANGDIWNVEDYKRCIEVSGCDDVMLGRGLVAQPDLALQIKDSTQRKNFFDWESFLFSFMEKSFLAKGDHYAVSRTKQLTKLMGRTYPESRQLFEQIKRMKVYDEILNVSQDFFRNKVSFPSQDKIS